MALLCLCAMYTPTTLSVQDGSGEIDLEELRTVMTSLGYSPTDKQLEDMMAKVCYGMLCLLCYAMPELRHRTQSTLTAVRSSDAKWKAFSSQHTLTLFSTIAVLEQRWWWWCMS